jgi:hypothetical protein
MSTTPKKSSARPATASAKPKSAAAPKALQPAKPKPVGKPKPAAPAPAAGGKIAVLLALLRQEGGTTVAAMMAATGWQAHSVRGAISGAIRKQGVSVSSIKVDGVRTYKAGPGA